MRSSATDARPVFDAIVSNVLRLFGTRYAAVFLLRGNMLELAAVKGDAAFDQRHGELAKRFQQSFPQPVEESTFTGKALRSGQVMQLAPIIGNPQATPQAVALAKTWGYNALVVAPLVRDGEVVGCIGTAHPKARRLGDKELSLLKAFAAQAVIAIENVRLFNETKEALEQQTATSQVLAVISSSPTDLRPVFDAILKSAMQLCEAHLGLLNLYDGERLRTVAQRGGSVEFAKWVFERGAFKPDGGAVTRAIAERRPCQVADAKEGTGYLERRPNITKFVDLGGVRTFLAVPLVKDDKVVGNIGIYRPEVRPFTEKQIALVSMFASQAVIAIENVRLFNETREALERQTATADILRVISASPTDIQPVLRAVAESAARLCEASNIHIRLLDGDRMPVVMHIGDIPIPPYASEQRVSPRSIAGRVILERKTIHVDDILEPDVRAEYSEGYFVNVGDTFRTGLVVPLIREGTAIGTIAARRGEVRPFSEQQIKLLEMFAAQAVIAIENVRLFNETKEALEQQTATAEILRVISSSPNDIQPVFDSILEHAMRLCDAGLGTVGLYDGKNYQHVAQHGGGPEYVKWLFSGSFEPSPNSTLGHIIAERQPFHIADYRELPAYRERNPRAVATVELGGARTYLAVPMLKEGRVIGGITIRRAEVRPFTQKQIDLVSTFANQAVIAIENVRLFNETKEAAERQTATAEVLGVISSSPSDLTPVYRTILGNVTRLCEANIAALFLHDGKHLKAVAHHNVTPEFAAHLDRAHMKPSRETCTRLAALEHRVVHVEDYLNDPAFSPDELHRREGGRTILSVPLLRKGELVGVMTTWRREPRRFTEPQVALVKTFADQAVIAIENVRLFNETREALEQQTAISEVLRVISSSPADVRPVLDAVTARAAKICDAADANLFLVDGEQMRRAARFGDMAVSVEIGGTLPLNRGSTAGRAIIDRAAVHIEDLEAIPREEFPVSRQIQDRIGHRTMLAVPLLRENAALGVIVLRRMEVRLFTEKQIALLKTFADQAAIAIENVRLFNETEEALKQQTATAEVLKTISRSTFDLDAVLQTLLDNATRLSAAERAIMLRPDAEGNYLPVATYNYDPDSGLVARLRERPIRAGRDSVNGRVLLERRPIHIPDVLADPEYGRQDLVEAEGYRTVLSVPMLRNGEAIGLISLTKGTGVQPFNDKQIELVTTFADQAVIAIENVRLFKEIEEKSAQLEVANKHKSDFLANMSHELRTPLNAIIGFSEALMERMFGEVNEKQADYLKDIHESGRHLLSLINDILDLSKIEAGRMDLEVSTFHLPTALSNAMTLIRERAQRHGIELGLEVDQQLGEFQADERKFKQIMLNLLSNAVKFTPDGGRVDVCAKKDTDKIEIAVKDTGIGIAPEDQAAVFEEFKQVGRDQMRKAEGTGLGLALTRRFVELHGGAIRLESAPGKGSTFTVSLPLRQ